jgi:hypothetical protein
VQEFYLSDTLYGNVQEDIAKDTPEPLGKPLVLVSNVDSMLTGCSLTGILHFCNQTLFDWLSKRKAGVQTVTFGSEFVAAQFVLIKFVDLRSTLRY